MRVLLQWGRRAWVKWEVLEENSFRFCLLVCGLRFIRIVW